jgi:hypothetical protein
MLSCAFTIRWVWPEKWLLKCCSCSCRWSETILWTAATNGPFRPQNHEYGERRWNDIDRGRPKISERNLSEWDFTQHKSHMNWHACEPGSPQWETADYLNHGTTFWNVNLYSVMKRAENVRKFNCICLKKENEDKKRRPWHVAPRLGGCGSMQQRCAALPKFGQPSANPTFPPLPSSIIFFFYHFLLYPSFSLIFRSIYYRTLSYWRQHLRTFVFDGLTDACT